MLRRIAIIPTMMAMLTVLFTMAVPHHHHHAMICLVHEVCVLDGCCDDEHTMHSDPNQEEEENHCVSHEKYVPSDDVRIDFSAMAAPVIRIPVAYKTISFSNLHSQTYLESSSSPPILAWRINC